MTALATERLPDPLVTPLLALLKDAANAKLRADMEAAGIEPVDVISATQPYPADAKSLTASPSLPLLACYRTRQQSVRRTFGHRDYLTTLRLHYISSPTAADRLDERWPILDRVWRAVFDALCAGHDAAHLDDELVLEDAGVIAVNEAATKAEGYLPGSDYALPQWEADVQVTWRDTTRTDTSALYPVLSLTARITQAIDGDPRPANGDVVITAYTPTGIEELDSEPFEEESELP